MNRLSPAGITAWSWVSSLGKFHSEEPRPPLSTCLQSEKLASHEAELGIPGYSGRYLGELSQLPKEHLHRDSRCARLLYEALTPLRTHAELLRTKWGPKRIAVVLGSSTGGIDATEAALRHERKTGLLPPGYRFRDVHPYDSLLELVRGILELEGPSLIVSTACSSGGKALASAQRILHAGFADAALVGGADALCEMTVRGFAGLGVLSEEPCRPFHKNRSGIHIGEGAALLFLEAESAAPVQLLGAGESSDAFHATAPHPEGLGAELALRACLNISGLSPEDVHYLNAHGTGTDKNDSMESLAIARVFNKGICFSSTKGKTGHQLGTAGATEAIVCVEAISEGKAPRDLDPEIWDESLAVRSRYGAQRVDVALSNSFAFGGSNVVVALGRKRPDTPKRLHESPACYVSGVALWTPFHPDAEAFSQGRTSAPAKEPPARLLPARARGRASILTRIFAELYAQLLPEDPRHDDATQIPTVYSSCFGEMETTLQLLNQLESDLRLSPIRFQASVHNTASGRLSLEMKNRSFSTALAAGQASFAMALLEAQAWLAAHGGEILVLVAEETLPPRLDPSLTFLPLGVGLRLSSTPNINSPNIAAMAKLISVCDADDAHGADNARGTDNARRTNNARGTNNAHVINEAHGADFHSADATVAESTFAETQGDPRFTPFHGAPPAWGLALVDALQTKKRGAQVVGPGWLTELKNVPHL